MRLDGGAMFGNAPKDLWGRWMAADDRNMIDIASNCLLVRSPDACLLFETGTGAFLSPEMKHRFGVVGEDHVLLSSLEKEGLGHEDITHVILSHLHFDHSGGLLTAHDPDRKPALLFPNARYIAGRANVERSGSPHIRDRASFIPGLAKLLEQSGRLDLKEDGDLLGLDGVEVEFFESHGHTPGMLISFIRAAGINLVFAGDLAAGHHWVDLPITMGYDRYPELLVNEKHEMLKRAMDLDAWLVYPHGEYPASKLALDEKKKRFVPVDLTSKLHLVEALS